MSANFIKAANNRQPWHERRLITAIAALYALTQVITFLRMYSQLKLDNSSIDLNMMIRDRLVAWGVGVVFAIIIVRTTRFLLQQRNWAWPRIIITHLAFAFFFSIVWYATLIGAHHLFCTGAECDELSQDLLFWFLINFDKLFLLYLVTVSITYTFYYVRRDHDNQLRHAHVQTQFLQAHLKTLRSQLQPHFLFNTLNSIASLMDIDIDRAKVMLADLGDLLRRVLDWSDIQMVPLSDELDLLSKYVNIEKTRFSDDLDVNWKIDPDLRDAEVPAMLLQPLVENAIRHGFSRNHLELAINIEAFAADGHLHLRVCDNGQGLNLADGKDIFNKGTGLQNTRERLMSIYGDLCSFTVTNTHPGACSHIILPLHLQRKDAEPAAPTQPPRQVVAS